MAGARNMTCPECGTTAPSEPAMHNPRRRLRTFRMAIALIALLVAALSWNAHSAPWTLKLPTVVVQTLLDVAAPPPQNGTPLPRPNPSYQYSGSPWERIVWQHQTHAALQVWVDGMLSAHGPITDAELARLVPIASAAHELHASTAATRYEDSWVRDRGREHLVRQRATVSRDSDRAVRIEWALGEMQFDGEGSWNAPDFALIPDAIIERAMRHADPAVRLFGVERLGRRAFARVLNTKAPLPDLLPLLDELKTSDPDTKVRQRAKEIIEYIETFIFYKGR